MHSKLCLLRPPTAELLFYVFPSGACEQGATAYDKRRFHHEGHEEHEKKKSPILRGLLQTACLHRALIINQAFVVPCLRQETLAPKLCLGMHAQ